MKDQEFTQDTDSKYVKPAAKGSTTLKEFSNAMPMAIPRHAVAVGNGDVNENFKCASKNARMESEVSENFPNIQPKVWMSFVSEGPNPRVGDQIRARDTVEIVDACDTLRDIEVMVTATTSLPSTAESDLESTKATPQPNDTDGDYALLHIITGTTLTVHVCQNKMAITHSVTLFKECS